jgi:hypothetical protein
MTSDNTANNGGQKPPSGDEGVKRARRTQTNAEKAARQEKRLRDQYGNSRLDPNEPPLHGLTAAAILCALDLLRRAFRSAGGFKPKSMADKVASICSLSADQHKLLIRWLAWAKPRRWVLQEEGRSAVVAWSLSRPDNAAVWTAALDAQWRARIQNSVASKETDTPARELPNVASRPREAVPTGAPKPSNSGENPSRSGPVPQAGVAAPAPRDSGGRSDTSFRSDPSPPSGGQQPPAASQPIERRFSAPNLAKGWIDRNKIADFPDPAFQSGAHTANRFARAALDFLRSQGSADNLRIAADGLRRDVFACLEFSQRSHGHRKFVESIFQQLGWEVP